MSERRRFLLAFVISLVVIFVRNSLRESRNIKSNLSNIERRCVAAYSKKNKMNSAPENCVTSKRISTDGIINVLQLKNV